MQGVETLREMRAESKSGGAVGQVTEKEWPILQNQITSLGQRQGTEQFRENLKQIRATLMRMQNLTKQEYEKQYGSMDWKPINSGGIKSGTVEQGYRFMGGDPSDKSNWQKVE